MVQVAYSDCQHGLRPCEDPTPTKVKVVCEIWSGQRPIKFSLSQKGTWAVAFCSETDKRRLSVPTIAAPDTNYLPPPTSLPVDFIEATPEHFVEIADPRNANWELFVARRLAAEYRPAFPHLRCGVRWCSLLPPKFTESDVELVYRPNSNVVSLPDAKVFFPNIAKMSKEDLLTLVKGKLRCAEPPISELHTHLWWRECAQGMQESVPPSIGVQYHMQTPILMHCNDPDDLTRTHIHRRPELPNAPQLERRYQPFAGITPLPRSYLEARAQEHRLEVL